MPGLNPDLSPLQREYDDQSMHTPEAPTKPVTIAELEQTLARNRKTDDGRLAAILSGLSLTERANRARVSRWNAEFAGSHTREALRVIADASAFLALPAEDTSAKPPPSPAEQHQMLIAVGLYLGNILPALPNFRATRATTYYQDRPPREWTLSTDPAMAEPLRNRPLHVLSTSRTQVAYVGGQEVMEKKEGFEGSKGDSSRFTTAGEFGAIIYGVMMDANQSNLAWGRWEPGPHGDLAVFQFDAVKEKSHFSFRAPGSAQSQFLAYHGEFTIDPANGSIVRLTVTAHPHSGSGTEEADIDVEYDSVEIGQRTYVCPVHAIALAKVSMAAKTNKDKKAAPLQTEINDVEFVQYHVFRGDSRILQGSTVQP